MSMQDKIYGKSLIKTGSWDSFQNLQEMTDKEIIDKLFEIIN